MSDAKYPSKILGYLYLGGKQDAKAKNVLQHLKIKYILNATPTRSVDPESGCPSFFEKEKSFVYSRIPVFDNRGEDLLQYMDQSFRFIEEGKHYGGVLVHCHKGVSRSSSFVIGYLMKKNAMSLDEALSYVKTIRPIVMPNLAFMAQLRAYELILNRERESSNESFDKKCSTDIDPPSAINFLDIGPSVGPSILQPSESTLEPSALLPVGPSLGPSIQPQKGPSMQPQMGPSMQPQKGPSMQPQMGPSIQPLMGPSVGPSPYTGPSVGLSVGSCINNSSMSGPEKVIEAVRSPAHASVTVGNISEEFLSTVETESATIKSMPSSSSINQISSRPAIDNNDGKIIMSLSPSSTKRKLLEPDFRGTSEDIKCSKYLKST